MANLLSTSGRSLKLWTAVIFIVSGILAVVLNASAQSMKHPMDPLTAEEYSAAVKVLKTEKKVDDETRFSLITLLEPPKSTVLAWKPGTPVSRKAFASVKKGPDIFEAIVDITGEAVASWKRITGVQPGVLTEEWTSAQEIVRSDPAWQAAVRKRGITDFENVVCLPLTVGYFGIAEEEGRRLFKVASFDSRGTRNFWARPIEGLTAVVDIEKGEVIKLIDTGVLPIPEGTADLDEVSAGPLREAPNPISMVQPEGPSFKVDNNQVSWQNWNFHFRIDPRLGPVSGRYIRALRPLHGS